MIHNSLELTNSAEEMLREIGELCNNLNLNDKVVCFETIVEEAPLKRRQTNRVEEPFYATTCNGKQCKHPKLAVGLLVSFQDEWWRVKKALTSCKLSTAIHTQEIVKTEEDELQYTKACLVEEFENILLDAEKNTMQDDVFFAKCWGANEHMTVEKLMRVAKQGYEMLHDLEIVQCAVDSKKWHTNPDLYLKNIPRIQTNGIDYDLTYIQKANALGRVFAALPRGAMFMSATISCPDKADEYKFEDFYTECGLPSSTPALQTQEVFDSRRLTIYVPRMKKYKYSSDDAYKREYENERIAHLERTISLNPKSSLVVGNNLLDIQGVYETMKLRMQDCCHILYNSEREAFDDFVAGTKNNVVIYGSERLFTGVDLPGRIGLVAILKPFNEVRIINETYYKSIRATYQKDYNSDVMDTYDQLYRYNTCRCTIQAAGRVLRTSTDSGIVLFLSNNRTDALMLQERYRHAPLVDTLHTWPY
tara:strand:+ start:191 stop:1618 length:1428 start_codon:yes stop_codon:yes gene_type:complete